MGHLKGDIFGGITAGVVALPLALAFGVQSGLGAIAGLYGAMTLGVFAAFFGGTPTQISGPTGPMTVVAAVVIATAIDQAGSLQAAMSVILATFILAGALQIVLGIIRIGQYIRYIPYPVLSGFMSGIGVIIILLQVFPLLGHDAPKKVVDSVLTIHMPLSDINLYALAIAALTIGIIYLIPRITKAVPSTLVALVICTIISVIWHFPIAVIGDIPAGLPALKLDTILKFDPTMLTIILVPAITLAALGAIDSLLTSVVADNITKTKHNSNKELVGQGIGNMLVALIGGLPGAGATMRTMVNVNSGGRTRLSGIIHGVLLFGVLVGASKYAALIPLPVLAGILITVGIGIIDYKGIRHIVNIPKTDALVMLIVFFMTVFIDLLVAVGVGMVLSSVLFMKKMGDIAEEKVVTGSIDDFKHELPWDDETDIPSDIASKVYVKHLYGPLFFGFANQLQAIFRSMPEMEAVVIRMNKVPYMDQSGLYAIENAVLDLEEKGIEVVMTGLQGQPHDMMRSIGLIPNLIAESHIFETFPLCNEWLKKKCQSGQE